MYSDADVAALHDILNGWGTGDDFYLSHVMAAANVLDVGCGTGPHLRRARDSGHTGRLCGVDPDPAMLAQARRRDDIEWHHGSAAMMPFDGEFDLAIMAGNAFQCFITDDDLRFSLRAIRAALAHRGRFVFGTRNPAARAWEGWNGSGATTVTDHEGRTVTVTHHVESVVDGVVTLTESTFADGQTRVDRGSLRFLDVPTLDAFLVEAGFEVEQRFGSFTRDPFTEASPTIVTVARTTG